VANKKFVSSARLQSAKDKNFLEKIGDRIVSTVKGIQVEIFENGFSP
jgi:hypothetical protein